MECLLLLAGFLLGVFVTIVFFWRSWKSTQTELLQTRTALAQAQTELKVARSSPDASALQSLAPVAEKLTTLQRQVSLLERDRLEHYGQLTQQLHDARAMDQLLLQTTRSLESSLRSTTARGRWGELQLRRIVEITGLLPHVDFDEQTHRESVDGKQRPDLVIHLPNNQDIFVDAKVPLSAFLESQEVEAAQTMRHHAKALRNHVNDLAKKRYWDLTSSSPELVLCFLPAESILSAALNADGELLDYALSKGVLLTSPVSLLAALKAIAYSWRQEHIVENARELFALSTELYERLATLGKNLGQLGSSLNTSIERFNTTVGSFESRVLPTARKLHGLEPEILQAPSPVSKKIRQTPKDPQHA